MSLPNDKGPRWAPPTGRTKRSGSPPSHRRYQALDLWRAARQRGVTFAANDPLERAACREANAVELDHLASAARSPREAAVWRSAADAEMGESVAILAEAQRRLQAAQG
jgi:hypothetical protein